MIYDSLGLFYDHFYTDGSMTDSEIAFLQWAFQTLARRPVQEVLDVSCGTGRQALRLADMGYRVTASDPSAPMLEALRAKPEASRLQAIRQRPMQDLDEVEDCDAVITVFTALNHLLEDADLERTFAGFHRALRPGGLAVFDVGNFLHLVENYKPFMQRHVQNAGPYDEILSVVRHRIDDVGAIFHHHEDIFCRTGDTWTRHAEDIPMRIFTGPEIAGHLRRAGFGGVRTFRGWEDRGESRENTFRLVFAATR